MRFSNTLTDSFANRNYNSHNIFLHDTVTAIVSTGDNKNTTYNAKAHPALSNDRELLISYNMNGGGWDAFNYGDIYRPRFIRYAQVPLTPGN